MDKATRRLVRLTLVVVFLTTALPELATKPNLFMQLTYAARMIVIMGWLWWLTVDKSK